MKSNEFLTKVVIGEISSAKPWSASDIESGRGSHLKNDKLEPGDKFEYGYFNEPKGNGTVIELVGGIGKESINAKLDDGRIVKMPYLGSKPKNGYYIRKIIDKNVNEDFEKNVQDYAKLEKFVEFAKNKLESTSGSTLDLVAKKLSEYEAENFVNDYIERNVYKTRGYGLTPIVTQLYLDEREKRGIEDTSHKPNSVNYVNTPFGAISGPEAYWDVEISKWGGANGREIANDLINAGYVENKKEFLYMISLVKTMPELRQEIEDSGIKVGSLDEYILYAKELKGQGLIGNQEYLNSPYSDEKLEKALAKQIKESKEQLDENLHKWFKEKWVRFGPDGKIRGDCARGDDSEGKPKCLPQAKAHALGKKGRKYAASKKRREDPNPERRGPAKNVATKKKSNEGVAEGVPQPGPSSGAPKQFGADAEIQTRQMTVKDIISSVPGVPYYNNVVDDWDAKDYSWGVTKKVIEYATYLKDHPESLAKLPPAIVLNGKFEDGAHRVSAIWLLQQRMDPKNPLWKNAKLNVQFVKQGVAEGYSNTTFNVGHLQEAVQTLGPQLYVPRQATNEDLKPKAQIWTSSAIQRQNGYTSAWVEWSKTAMPEWVSKEGILYDVSPGARILNINSDQDAMRIARKYGVKVRNEIDLFMHMPWDLISKDYDAIHHVPKNRGLYMSAWDVESTAWLNKKFLINPRKVIVDNEQPSEPGVAEGAIDNASPMFKDSIKQDKIRSLKNLIAIAKEQGRKLRVQELELELKKLQGVAEEQLDELKCWPGYHRVKGTKAGFPGSCAKNKTNEEHEHKCPHCGGELVSEELMNEKKDACYYKVKSRYKVWPSAYASGALVKCRKKGAKNWGTKSESQLDELSPETLASYKKKAGQQASELDKAAFSGDKDAKTKIAKANKRFSGIVKATKKELDKPKDKVDEFVQGYNMGQAGYRKFKPKHVPNQDEIQKMSGVMESITQVDEKWSQKYKNSINCSNPKGFSQRAHCQGRKK